MLTNTLPPVPWAVEDKIKQHYSDVVDELWLYTQNAVEAYYLEHHDINYEHADIIETATEIHSEFLQQLA